MKSENDPLKKMGKHFSGLETGWAVLSITVKAESIKADIVWITA